VTLLAHAASSGCGPTRVYGGSVYTREWGGDFLPGNAAIGRLDGSGEPRILKTKEIPGFDPYVGHLVQLDVRGGFVELRVWRKGEGFPPEPLLQVSDATYRSGGAGIDCHFLGPERGGPDRYCEFEYVRVEDRMITVEIADDCPSTVPARFLRAESNGDGKVDLSDAVYILSWLFLGRPAPGCLAAANINGDAAVDISDPVSLLNSLFSGGPPPAQPFPDCGVSGLVVDSELGCETPPSCP
jgi:hypothetical protein